MDVAASGEPGSQSERLSAGETKGVTESEQTIHIHTFSGTIMNTCVYFQVIKLSESFHLWLGTSPKFGEMAVAMTSAKFPCSSAILGGSDSTNVALAQRLSKRTGRQVFVSGDIPFDQLKLPLIEKRIAEEINAKPDAF